MNRHTARTSRRPNTVAAVLVVALLLFAGACGDDEGYSWAGTDGGEAPEREGRAGWSGNRSGDRQGSGSDSDENGESSDETNGNGNQSDGRSGNGQSSGEGDGGSTRRQRTYSVDDYVRAAGTEPTADNALSSLLPPDDFTCLVRSFVVGVGVERLNRRGITPQRLIRAEFQLGDIVSPQQEVDLVLGGLAECTDVAALVSNAVSLSPENERCLSNEVAERDLAGSLVGILNPAALRNNSELVAATDRVVAACPGALSMLGR
ncbi:MAG: hypothetical protein JJU45_06365 [Acidimicrobiia bacterium]|nr:hypothetical protein [Acidimicrobiia bacterium]